MLNELTTTASFNRIKVQVRVLMALRMADPEVPMFRLLASPKSPVRSVKDLAGVSVGISKNTVIEYVTDRLLQAEGLDPVRIRKRSVPVIPERYQLLMQNRLEAAVLPDPLGKSAIESGAHRIIDDSAYPQYSVSVLSFSIEAVAGKPKAIRSFLKAWDRAAEDINRNPDTYRPLLLEKIRIPKQIQSTFPIPPFTRSAVPSASQWTDVIRWMTAKGLLSSPLTYEGSVSPAFLPSD